MPYNIDAIVLFVYKVPWAKDRHCPDDSLPVMEKMPFLLQISHEHGTLIAACDMGPLLLHVTLKMLTY